MHGKMQLDLTIDFASVVQLDKRYRRDSRITAD